MSNLMSIFETEIVKGKKIVPSDRVHLAVIRTQRKEAQTGHKVELTDFLLEMYNIVQEEDNYRGNKNASK